MVLCMSNGSTTSFAGMGPIVRFNDAGKIDARNGGAYAAGASMNYEAGKQYQFRLVIDMAKRTYDVFVTPAGGTAVKLATAYAFRSELSAVTQLNNFATRNEGGDATVSGLAVAAVVAPVPTTPAGYFNTAIAAQTGTFTLQMNAKPLQTNQSVIFGLSNGAAGAVTDMAVAIRFNSAGVIDVRNGGSWNRTTAVRYKANITYAFRVEIDVVTGKFDVFVTPAGGRSEERRVGK